MAVLFISATAAQQSATPGNSATPAKTTKPVQHHSAKRGKNATAEPQNVPPPPPLTPEQMAPVAPKISYQAGQLTIESQNATLAQVLRSVQAKTGGSFDIPGSANSDRVVAQLGPGQPRDVLAKLLDGSKFNYIILGSPSQPGSVQKLILTPRQNVPNANRAQNRPVQPPSQELQPEDEYTPPEPSPLDDNSASGTQPPTAPFRPGNFIPNEPNQNGEFPPQQPAGQLDSNGRPVQNATPDQILQNLQRMQQQQQQLQQQLNPANQNPQPQPQPQPQ